MANRPRPVEEDRQYNQHQCVQANCSLKKENLVKLAFGNASVRQYNGELCYIKPSGVPVDQLYPDQIAVVVVATGEQIAGSKASVDTPIHLEVYRNFPQVKAITHTHSTNATSWAQAMKPIPCLGTTHADYFNGPVPVARQLTTLEIDNNYEANLGKAVVEWYNENGTTPLDVPAILLPAHGCLTFGRTYEAAVEAAVVLEEIATTAFMTLQLMLMSHIDKSVLADPLQGNVEDLYKKHYSRKHGPSKYYGQ